MAARFYSDNHGRYHEMHILKRETVSLAKIITINSARHNNNSDAPWPRKLFSRSKVKVAWANFCKFSSWLTALANKPTNDDLLNLTRDGCEHGTHLFSLFLSRTVFFSISCFAVEMSFDHLSYISHVYLSANNGKEKFSSRSRENKSRVFTMRNDF